MAQSSIGFKGTVDEIQWAKLASVVGHGPCLLRVGDLAVSQVSGNRAVTVGAGSAAGDGVLTAVSSAEQVAVPTPTNGQWFLLVLNRLWSDSSTRFLIRNSSTTATASSGLVPSSYPATLKSNPGVESDLPVAWLWANSTGTAVTVVPLLRAPSSVQPRVGNTAARDALYGVPNSLPARVALQGASWYNTDTARIEEYAAAVDSLYNSNGIYLDSGWFPQAERYVSGTVSPAAGITIDSTRSFLRRRGTQVAFQVFITRAAGLGILQSLASIPAGFRPTAVVAGNAVLVNGNTPGTLGVYISPDGTVTSNGYLHIPGGGTAYSALAMLVYEVQ